MGEKKGDAMCSAKTVTFGGVVAYPKAPAAGTIEQTKARFNCIGTLRDSLKMVGSNGSKFLTVRLVRSKLRKREETAVAAATAAAATAITTANATAAAATAITVNNNSISNNNNVDCQQQQQQQQAIDVTVVTGVPAADVVDAPVPLPFLWQYSAKNAAAKNNGAANGYNSPYRLYNSDQVNETSLLYYHLLPLVHDIACRSCAIGLGLLSVNVPRKVGGGLDGIKSTCQRSPIDDKTWSLHHHIGTL